MPYYQQLARAITLPRMQAWVTRLKYSNADIGTVVDRFWLDGPLAISPIEQVRFLEQLYDKRLPAAARYQASVKDIMFVEQIGAAKLYGKSGWTDAVEPQIGWYVGFVESEHEAHAFAMLARARGKPEGEESISADSLQTHRLIPLRKELTLELLRGLEVLWGNKAK